LISFPNAKINIGLNITEKRSDGFHNLESIFLPIIGLHDVLEIVAVKDNQDFQFTASGIPIDGKENDNLVVKAYQLLKSDFSLPALHVHLHKVIPTGAGLGGGSSDASFMLKMLNEMFALNLTNEILKVYAEKLGSDCPFFIENTPQYATGKGEQLENLAFFIPSSYFAIIKPPIHIPTKVAFAGIVPKKNEFSIKEIAAKLPHQWKNLAKNDFEASIFDEYPEIKKIKNRLYELGADYASMSGSGSAVFGFFPHKINLANEFENYFKWQNYIRF